MIICRIQVLGLDAQLWPAWRHFAPLTSRTEDIIVVEPEHVTTLLLSK